MSPRPFQGLYVVHMLGLPTADLCTKFEICTVTHYKDTRGDKNAKIWVVLEGWGSHKVISNITILIEHIRLHILL